MQGISLVKFVQLVFFIVGSLFLHSSYSAQIHTGSIDDRRYLYQVLDNQLQVLLISDPDADKAAASLDVNVGSYHDPIDREGLAHFLEHMLFLGTQKYPEADEYQTFISDNGGSHNAYTSSHHTNYFFDIDAKQLDNALDRFAQFFISPLFDSFYVDRERNAVHSEYKASIRDDFRRGYDVYRNVINPKHPDAKFNVGNLETLADRPRDKVRDDLLDFYKQYYSADKMALVVLGKEPLTELQKMVVERFSKIPQTNAIAKKGVQTKTGVQQGLKSEPLFISDKLPLEVVSQPIKELRQMSMSFSVPSIREYYREKPLDFIAYLLGHEGKGSLLSLLKKEGLAESLSAGGRDNNDGTAAFYITMQLTKKGLKQRDLIRSLVFYAINQIKEKGIEEWRYNEKRLLAEIAFNFREKAGAISTVRGLANNLHQYPAEDVIRGDYVMLNYTPDTIKYFLSLMTPDNVYVSTVFPEAEISKTTTYYQVPYSVSALSKKLPSLSNKLTAQFQLPEKNPFIPENISLYKKDLSLTEPLKLTEGDFNVWAKQDISFNTPKVKVLYRILSPRVSGSLKGVAMATLYTDLLSDRLNEYSYPALLADTALSVRSSNRGIDITLDGYHDKLHELMNLLMEEIDNNAIDKKRFSQLKTDLLRRWRNADKRTPYRQLYNQLVVNLYDSFWTNSAKANALESVTLSDLRAFADEWREGSQVQGLYYGNLDHEWLKNWELYVQKLQLLGESNIAPINIAKLDSANAQYNVFDIDHTDQAVVLYFQGLEDTVEDRAAMTVLRQIMQSPFYSSLRTEQQLGYVVFMGSLSLKQVPGSVFVVQSPSADVDKIGGAMQQFITEFESKLPDDISIYQQAVITQLLEEPQSLSASANDYWNNLLQDNETFNNRELLAQAVERLTADQLRDYYQQALKTPARSLWQYSRPPVKSQQIPFKFSNEVYSYP